MKMDVEEIKKSFWENGYIVFENFFDGNLMDTYNQIVFDRL